MRHRARRKSRRNPWYKDGFGHGIASLEGWGKKKRVKSVRRYVMAGGKHCGKYPYGKKRIRARMRRGFKHTRFSFPLAFSPRKYKSVRHKRGGRRSMYRRIAANPSIRSYSRKGRRVRSYKRRGRRSGYRTHRYYRNTGLSIMNNPIMDSVKSIFTMDTLKDGAFVGMGAIAPSLATDLIFGKLLAGKVPEFLSLTDKNTGKDSIISYPIRLALGGVIAGVYTMITKNSVRGRQILIGAVSAELVRVYKNYAEGMVRKSIGLQGVGGMLGATESQIKQAILAQARRQMSGDNLLGATISPGSMYDAPMLGDYVTADSLDSAEALSGVDGATVEAL